VGYRLLVYAAVVAHFAFLAFALFGGYLAWRWPRLVWWHAASAAWLVLVAVARLGCPLTWIEDRARERAGMAAKPGGFLANHAEGVFYPADHRAAATAVAAVVVLGSWIGAVRQRRRRATLAPH
jgi:hypothetical protein